jgi:hypothetical protein
MPIEKPHGTGRGLEGLLPQGDSSHKGGWSQAAASDTAAQYINWDGSEDGSSGTYEDKKAYFLMLSKKMLDQMPGGPGEHENRTLALVDQFGPDFAKVRVRDLAQQEFEDGRLDEAGRDAAIASGDKEIDLIMGGQRSGFTQDDPFPEHGIGDAAPYDSPRADMPEGTKDATDPASIPDEPAHDSDAHGHDHDNGHDHGHSTGSSEAAAGTTNADVPEGAAVGG